MARYCSWCLKPARAKEVKGSLLTRNLYKCGNCGRHLVECRACESYARWQKVTETGPDGKEVKRWWHDQFCLEHRHEIANFDTLESSLDRPSDHRKVYEYRVRNLSKAGKVGLAVAGGAIVLGPLAWVAAPAVGGAIGAAAGFTGAAATSYGLAVLGLGAVAAGGFGMAGGMVVLTAVGVALGGAAGAWLGTRYFGEIDGFDVKQVVRPGKYPAVVTINGFLSQPDKKNEQGFQDWKAVVERKYPGHAWFHVYWESKRLASFGALVGGEAVSKAFRRAVEKAALRATKKAAKKLAPGAAFADVLALATNPWHVAWVRAEQTGALLADILRRTKGDHRFVLMGHSLGCRVVYAALTALASTGNPVVEDVHLTGGAVDADPAHWSAASKAVTGHIHNYHSGHDAVLKYLYSVGTFFVSSPIGRNAIEGVEKVSNHDVSEHVSGHMAYKENAVRFM